MKKHNLPNKTFLTNFAMQTILLIILFVCNIFSQVIINERVEINPTTQSTDRLLSEGDGWWIDTCYFENYNSFEIDLRFTPSSIEPGETATMTLWVIASPPYEYNEEWNNFLERNITLEPNLGSISRTVTEFISILLQVQHLEILLWLSK